MIATTRCECGKVGYVSKAEARLAARQVGRHTGYKYNTYRCPTSQLWHLASKERS